MKTTSKTALGLTILLIATVSLSTAQQDNKKSEGAKKSRGGKSPLTVENVGKRFSNIKMTPQQLAKLRPIVLRFRGKLDEARAKFDGVISKPLQDARAAASKKLQAEGLSGSKLAKAVDAAVEMTEEQQSAVDEFRSTRKKLDEELRKAMYGELNSEQRRMVGIPSRKKKEDEKKKGGNTKKKQTAEEKQEPTPSQG